MQKCFRCMLLFGFTGLAVGFFLLGPSPFLNFLPAKYVIDMTSPCNNSRNFTVVKCHSPFTMWSPNTWAHRHVCLGWVICGSFSSAPMKKLRFLIYAYAQGHWSLLEKKGDCYPSFCSNLCGKCLTPFEIIQKLFRLEMKYPTTLESGVSRLPGNNILGVTFDYFCKIVCL